VAHAERRTNSCSPQPRKTCGGSRDCGQRCRQWRQWRDSPPIRRSRGRPRDRA
jgi:hypothetical protein